jgi:hypothetical protein
MYYEITLTRSLRKRKKKKEKRRKKLRQSAKTRKHRGMNNTLDMVEH